MGIIGSHVDLYLLAAGTSSKTAVGSGIRLIVRAIRRLSRTGISTVAGAMGISRQEPPRKTLHSLCYPPRDAPLRRSRRCPSFSAHKVNGTKRSPPPLPPLFLAVPAVPAYAAVVPALSRPPETRYLLIPRRKSSDADKESTQTARRQLPLQPFERSFTVAKKPRSTVLARRLCAETPAPQFAHLGPGIFAISCRAPRVVRGGSVGRPCAGCRRSEEHTSELQSP